MSKDCRENISNIVSLALAILISFVQYKLCKKLEWGILSNIFLSIVLFFVLYHAINGIMYLIFKYKDKHKAKQEEEERIKKESIKRAEKERIEKAREREKQLRKNEMINSILNSPAFVKIADAVIQNIRSFKFQGYDERKKICTEYLNVFYILDRMDLYKNGIVIDHRSELVEALAIYLNSNKNILETSDISIISLEPRVLREDSVGYDDLRIEYLNKNYIEPQIRL